MHQTTLLPGYMTKVPTSSDASSAFYRNFGKNYIEVYSNTYSDNNKKPIMSKRAKSFDIIHELDNRYMKEIYLATWNRQGTSKILPAKIVDINPPLTERMSFLRDMAILICYDNPRLLDHNKKYDWDSNEILTTFWEERNNAILHAGKALDIPSPRINPTEFFPMRKAFLMRMAQKLWYDIREGNGVWEKYL